jgi:hypothetical protein
MCRSADYTPASKRRKGEFIKFPVEKSQKRTSGENLTVAPTEGAKPQGPGAIERDRLKSILGRDSLLSYAAMKTFVVRSTFLVVFRRFWPPLKWNKSLQYGL